MDKYENNTKSNMNYGHNNSGSSGDEKKKKTIIIIVSVVLILAILAGAAVGIVFALKKRRVSPSKFKPLSNENQHYSFAFLESENSFVLPKELFGENIPQSFDIKTSLDDNLILDGYTIKIKKYLEDNLEDPKDLEGVYGVASYSFSKNDITYLTIDIRVFKSAVKIASANDLKSIEEDAEGNYIQVNDIDLANQEISIEGFKGVYCGNQKSIKNLNVSKNRGLFINPNEAEFAGINILNGTAVISDSNNLSVGFIANKSNFSKFISCAVQGSIKLNSSNPDATVFVGGIVGIAENERFRYQEDARYGRIIGCSSKVSIDVNALGSVHIGGVVGRTTGTYLASCKSYEKLNFVSNKEGAKTIYIGGISGYTNIDISSSSSNLYNSQVPLESSENFYSTSDISMTLSNDSAPISVGGIFGRIDNMQLSNLDYLGKIYVSFGMSEVNAGNIIGAAYNEVYDEDNKWSMNISHSSASNKIVLVGDGAIRSGSFVGLIEAKIINGIKAVRFDDMKANKLSDIKALHTEITRNNEVGSDTYSNGYYGLYKQP